MKRYFLKRNGRAIVKSRVDTEGSRPARLRVPTKSWNSSTADHGNPVRHSYNRREHPWAARPIEPRTTIRWGTSVGLSEFSLGRMIGFLKLPKN